MKKTPLKKFAKKSRAIIPAAVRREVEERSGGQCEFVWRGTRCPYAASEMHHVLARSQGGKHTASNLLHSCQPDHLWTKLYPKQAIALGFVKLMGAYK